MWTHVKQIMNKAIHAQPAREHPYNSLHDLPLMSLDFFLAIRMSATGHGTAKDKASTAMKIT